MHFGVGLRAEPDPELRQRPSRTSGRAGPSLSAVGTVYPVLGTSTLPAPRSGALAATSIGAASDPRHLTARPPARAPAHLRTSASLAVTRGTVTRPLGRCPQPTPDGLHGGPPGWVGRPPCAPEPPSVRAHEDRTAGGCPSRGDFAQDAVGVPRRRPGAVAATQWWRTSIRRHLPLNLGTPWATGGSVARPRALWVTPPRRGNTLSGHNGPGSPVGEWTAWVRGVAASWSRRGGSSGSGCGRILRIQDPPRSPDRTPSAGGGPRTTRSGSAGALRWRHVRAAGITGLRWSAPCPRRRPGRAACAARRHRPA
jgi:hypothetical protein